uniref:non-specific serine/threonine protein kinase n=1 Tax=viral metagenome TaxID=1070528 RepID=A0A6C0JH54_9ZZZZ
MEKYKILGKLGSGKFGTVFLGIHKKTQKNNENVAIKMEDLRTSHKLLKHETTILKYLYDHGCRTIPIVYWFGIFEQSTCLVMSLYDISLFDFIKKGEPTIEQINKIMIAAIEILDSIHKLLVLHRDIKPQNFMIKNSELYLIDFGLSTIYLRENGEHVPECSQDSIIGTPKYISFYVHDGRLPGVRDDLISLGYVYMYLFCRELPWDVLQTNSLDNEIFTELSIEHPKNKQRKEFKSWAYLETICLKINFNIHRYFQYCYGLKYKDSPNYEGLRNVFQ